MEYNYDIFLSYRHRPLDNIITQKTFNMLESYRLPRSLREKGHDIKRAFRDTEELAVSRILTDTIDKALHSCNCLLLVCSTDTPSSEWVDREVAMFIELGRAEKIFPLLISGDPETSFPPSLKRIPDIMDRVMDVRCEGNDIKKILRKEETALLKIIAAATDVPYRELQREHYQRRLKQSALRAGTAIAVFAAVTGISLGLMNRAQAYRDRAAITEEATMQVLYKLTYDIPEKLNPINGASERISGIVSENADQIDKILSLSTNQERAEKEIAANHEKLATAYSWSKKHEEAMDSQQEALSLYEKIGDTAGISSAKNNLGKLYDEIGKYREATALFEEAILLQRELDDPVTLASMLATAAFTYEKLGEYDTTEAYCKEALSLLDGREETFDVLKARSDAELYYGILCYQRRVETGSLLNAEAYLRKANSDWETLVEDMKKDSRTSKYKLVQAQTTLALVLTEQGKYTEAVSIYEKALGNISFLAGNDEDMATLTVLADILNNYGILCNMQGDYARSGLYYTQAAGFYDEIRNQSDSMEDTITYALSCMNAGDAFHKCGDYPESKAYFEKGLDAFPSVETKLTDQVRCEYLSWKAYYTLLYGNDPDTAVLLAWDARELNPDSLLANMILGYCSLYSGYYELCDDRLTLIASLGAGQLDMIRNDLAAQQAGGLHSPHMEELLKKLDGINQ